MQSYKARLHVSHERDTPNQRGICLVPQFRTASPILHRPTAAVGAVRPLRLDPLGQGLGERRLQRLGGPGLQGPEAAACRSHRRGARSGRKGQSISEEWRSGRAHGHQGFGLWLLRNTQGLTSGLDPLRRLGLTPAMEHPKGTPCSSVRRFSDLLRSRSARHRSLPSFSELEWRSRRGEGSPGGAEGEKNK